MPNWTGEFGERRMEQQLNSLCEVYEVCNASLVVIAVVSIRRLEVERERGGEGDTIAFVSASKAGLSAGLSTKFRLVAEEPAWRGKGANEGLGAAVANIDRPLGPSLLLRVSDATRRGRAAQPFFFFSFLFWRAVPPEAKKREKILGTFPFSVLGGRPRSRAGAGPCMVFVYVLRLRRRCAFLIPVHHGNEMDCVMMIGGGPSERRPERDAAVFGIPVAGLFIFWV
jgi:hypothetical protein